ncbi:MAG: glycosyltransferase family 9 protein, partial [Bdellovibrionota bacterium]
SAFVERLNDENYDLAINLTHSRLSGWLMNVISVREKQGLVFDAHGRASFGSNWFRYLNTQVDADGTEVFHFTDVFRFALKVDQIQARQPALEETIDGREECDAFLKDFGGGSNLVCVQALTSDEKKEWGLDRFEEAIKALANRAPTARIAILGAPSERQRLQSLIDGLNAAGVQARLAIVGFEAAYSLVKKAKLVISLDTSIKHLAACAGVPILEISLGSSDSYRTGAYADGSVIVKSKELCAPCVHSKPCHREKKFCAIGLPADAIAMIAGEMFEGRGFPLKSIADEYSKELEVLRVDTRKIGAFTAASVREQFSEQSVGRWIDLTCRRIWLAGAPASGLDGMGTEARRLGQFLRSLHPTVSDFEWRFLLGDFEKQATSIEGRLNGFKTEIRALHGAYEDPRRMRDYVRGLIGFREKMRSSALLGSFRAALDQVIEDDISPPFTRFRRIVDAIAEIDRRTTIHLRLIRSLERHIEDGIGVEKT